MYIGGVLRNSFVSFISTFSQPELDFNNLASNNHQYTSAGLHATVLTPFTKATVYICAQIVDSLC